MQAAYYGAGTPQLSRGVHFEIETDYFPAISMSTALTTVRHR